MNKITYKIKTTTDPIREILISNGTVFTLKFNYGAPAEWVPWYEARVTPSIIINALVEEIARLNNGSKFNELAIEMKNLMDKFGIE